MLRWWRLRRLKRLSEKLWRAAKDLEAWSEAFEQPIYGCEGYKGLKARKSRLKRAEYKVKTAELALMRPGEKLPKAPLNGTHSEGIFR